MKKYRKKPIVVEAEQWFRYKDVPEANIKKFIATLNPCTNCGMDNYVHGIIQTLEGKHIVCPGDWIIKGIKGEYYSCKPDIFKLTYEEIKE